MYCADRDRWGIRVKPASSRTFMDVVSSLSIFGIHDSAPYIRLCKTKNRVDCKDYPKGGFWPSYLNDARKLYAADYRGSLTIGIAWTIGNPDDNTAS